MRWNVWVEHVITMCKFVLLLVCFLFLVILHIWYWKCSSPNSRVCYSLYILYQEGCFPCAIFDKSAWMMNKITNKTNLKQTQNIKWSCCRTMPPLTHILLLLMLNNKKLTKTIFSQYLQSVCYWDLGLHHQED